MASEYLKWKYRDVGPEQAVELTPRQKRANWWYYHKWYVLLGLGLLAAALSIRLLCPCMVVTYPVSLASASVLSMKSCMPV